MVVKVATIIQTAFILTEKHVKRETLDVKGVVTCEGSIFTPFTANG